MQGLLFGLEQINRAQAGDKGKNAPSRGAENTGNERDDDHDPELPIFLFRSEQQ